MNGNGNMRTTLKVVPRTAAVKTGVSRRFQASLGTRPSRVPENWGSGRTARGLGGVGAVLVEGPKWCGKTTTCEQHAKSVLYMADPVRTASVGRCAGLSV